jgi:pimeloyl-ACP methyl ester carboxylesterase
VLFFDGGAGNCPAPLREARQVVVAKSAHVIGHAAGGHDALRFALTHPGRIGSLVLSETDAGLRLSRARLRSVTVPVLVVAGGSDSDCPLPRARKLAALFSSGRVAEIVEATRSPYLETPEEWCEVVLQFLRSVTRQSGPTP